MSKLVRIRMLGAGTPADPFRAPIPCYTRLIRDDETPFGVQAPRQCIIEIADRDYEPPQAGENVVTVNVAGIGDVIRQIAPTHRARWIAKLKAKYRENAPAYDVDVA